MFDFIDNILKRIGQFICDVILVVIIVLFVVLLVLASHRHANNPYVDHSREIQKQQIEADRDAQSQATPKRGGLLCP